MTLGPTSTDPSTRRPFQDGRVLGRQRAVQVAVDVEWLADTGADIVVLRDSVGASFDVVQSIGATASPTTGGGGIHVVTGIECEFTVEDAGGTSSTVRASGYVGVKSNDVGSNLLGVDQLAHVGASVAWDPAARAGSLRV